MSFYEDEYGNLIPVNQEDGYDDFHEMADQLAEAGSAPNGGVNSDIQTLGNFNRIRKVEDNREAQFVNINPVSAGVLDPKFGDEATVTAGASAAEVCRWEGKNGEARPVTIMVGIPRLSTLGVFTMSSGSAPSRAYALITFGVRNFKQTVKVDIAKGLQLSVIASAVYVSVGLDFDSSSTPGTMVVGASLGFFGVPRTSPVTCTLYRDTDIAAAGTWTVDIPTFARQLLPIQRSFSAPGGTLTPAAMLVNVRDINGTTIYSLYGGDTLYSIMSDPLPLSNDAYTIRVTNQDAAIVIPTMRLVFELGF